MDFYHGSRVGGLTQLRPYNSQYSNLNEAVVYLTTNKQLALHYIWNTDKIPEKMPMLNIRKDGVIVFQEMFSNALSYFYKNLSGYIYHCIGNYLPNNEVGVFTSVISKDPVNVVDFEYISDVYERILEYEKYGTFIYEKFEELPQYRHDIIRGIVMRYIKKENLLKNSNHPMYYFYQEKYPKYWQEAIVLEEKNLL
jgi:hypothetical protein